MNIRTGLAALTFVMGSLAAVPAFAQGRAYPPPYTQTPVAPAPAVVVVQPPQASAQVVVAPPQAQRANVRATMRYLNGARARLNTLATQLQTAINRGRVRVEAAAVFNARRAQIDVLLNRAGTDGVLGVREQRQIDRQISALADLQAQYRLQNGRGARR